MTQTTHRGSTHAWRPGLILALTLMLGACAGTIPKDQGVWHRCGMSVEVDGFGTALHETRICANRGLAHEQYEEACVDQCESDFSYVCVGLEYDQAEGEFKLFTCSPDCVTTTVFATSEDCRNASIVPGPPAIGQASVVLGPTSTTSVAIEDASSGDVTPAGTLVYSAAPCATPPCTFQLAAFRFTAPEFEIDDVPITGVLVQSAGLATGTIDAGGHFTIPSGQVRVSVNFIVDDEPGSITLTNTRPVVGIASPGANVFTVDGDFSQDGVTAHLALRGAHSNRAPVARIAPRGHVECTSTAGAAVTLDARGSTDPDPAGFADIAGFRWMIAGAVVGSTPTVDVSLPFGTTRVGLGLKDRASARAIDLADLTVADTTVPALQAPLDLTTECAASTGTPVSLGVPTATDVCDASLTLFNDAPALFDLGETTVTWSATDDAGNVARTAQRVRVADTTPPVLDVVLSHQVLWPPNHKLVPIEAAIQVSDGCDARPAVRLLSITSSEPDNATGDGNTTGDIQGAAFGQDDRAFSLRAERSGQGNGRTYAVTFEAKDASGNRTVRTVLVEAPHSAKK
jgi:hypothetical protein